LVRLRHGPFGCRQPRCGSAPGCQMCPEVGTLGHISPPRACRRRLRFTHQRIQCVLVLGRASFRSAWTHWQWSCISRSAWRQHLLSASVGHCSVRSSRLEPGPPTPAHVRILQRRTPTGPHTQACTALALSHVRGSRNHRPTALLTAQAARRPWVDLATQAEQKGRRDRVGLTAVESQ